MRMLYPVHNAAQALYSLKLAMRDHKAGWLTDDELRQVKQAQERTMAKHLDSATLTARDQAGLAQGAARSGKPPCGPGTGVPCEDQLPPQFAKKKKAAPAFGGKKAVPFAKK